LNKAELSYVGEAIKVESYRANISNLYTLSISVSQFTGRVFVEGSMNGGALSSDWFPIKLSSDSNFVAFSETTITIGINFQGVIPYLRASINRDYLNAQTYNTEFHGFLNKITVNY